MLEKLYDAIRRDAKPEIMEIGACKFSSAKIYPVEEPEPKTLFVSTLTGLTDYLTANVDELPKKDLLCHVESPSQVTLYSRLVEPFMQRFAYVSARLTPLRIKFGEWIDPEQFNIMMQSCFVDPDDPAQATSRSLILKYVANMKSVQENAVCDDGVTQTVSVKSGIASVANAALPNPVVLRPFRTFTEVEQPASSFVFRVKNAGDGSFYYSLNEADGGAWRGEAMSNIKKYLEDNIKGLKVIA